MSGEMLTGQAMPGESQTVTLGAAQENAATAQPQTDGGTGGDGESQVPAAKTFTQKDVDEIVKRAKAASESKTERRVMRTVERMLGQQQQQAPQARQDSQQQPKDDRPTRTQGETDDAYLERLADWKLDQRDRQTAAQKAQEQARTLGKKTTDLYAKAEQIGDDFDRDSFDEHLTKPIAEALVESDDAARLMHFLGAHSDEMQRIAQLPPARQQAELGKLEVRLEAEAAKAKETKPPQRSNAPQALAPAKGTPSANSMPDPSDTKAYIKWANAQEMAAR